MKSFLAFKESLKTFDFFGISYQFNVNGSSEFRSPLGGLLFLMFCFPVCYFMLTLTIITFRKQKYVINIHDEVVTTIKDVPVNQNENFKVAFSFKSTSPEFNPSDFDLSLFYREATKGYGMEEGKKTNIGFGKCAPEMFKGVDNSLYDFDLCPDASKSSLLILKGSIYDKKFSSLAVNVSVAKNKDLDTLMHKYKGHKLFFNFYTSNKEIRYLKTADILKNTVSTMQFIIDFNMTKRAVMYIKNTKCSFDNSIFWTEIESEQFSNFDFYDGFHSIKWDKEDKTLLEVDLGLETKEQLISRSFYKIEELLSDAGGLFSNLIFFFYLVMTAFNEKQCNLTILNRVFQFNNTAKNNKNIVLLKKQLSSADITQVDERERKDYVSPAFTGNIIFAAFCCCLLSKKSKKMYSLYSKGEDYLNHYLNVITYLNKMHQVSLIKDVILSTNQKVAFNFLTKPHISDYASRKAKEEIMKFRADAISNEELSSLREALKCLQDKANGIDERLVEMVDKKVDFIYKDLAK